MGRWWPRPDLPLRKIVENIFKVSDVAASIEDDAFLSVESPPRRFVLAVEPYLAIGVDNAVPGDGLLVRCFTEDVADTASSETATTSCSGEGAVGGHTAGWNETGEFYNTSAK